MIPLADPLPQPAPPGLLWALLQLSLLAHLVAVNVVLGGSLLALHYRFSRRAEGAMPRAALVAFFAKALPVAVAAAVTLGVAPLLFVQVLYGRPFLTGSILLAWPWLAVVPLVILACSGACFLAFRNRARGAGAVSVLVTVAFAAVAFLYVSNVTRALRPGLSLNLDDPTLWPRYLHVLLGALAIAGLGTALHGVYRRAHDPELADWAVRSGTTVFALASAVNVLAGLFLLLAQPRAVLMQLVGGGVYAPALVLSGIFLGTAVAAAALFALGAQNSVRATWALVGLTAATLVVMVLLRDNVRQAVLQQTGFENPAEVATQRGPLAVFVVLLLAAVATIAGMVRARARGGATAGLLLLAASLGAATPGPLRAERSGASASGAVSVRVPLR